ncbi:DUF6520 family protein [Mucilaginibacter sp.]|uniref:DUF6520 family protein n=1 Tax=Mucilaginibacter sp. TaxID=1882438 RepID=UPI00261A6819|nr:DUF6520 family protein [Mucilaginibacter sp.]MDB4918417.1 hypothetical protein [Mucilaginibacter sp.]
MKFFKANLMALALTIGIATAFASNAYTNYDSSNKKPPSYNWVQQNHDGSVTIGGYTLTNATVPQAKAYYGCSGDQAPCARATDQDGNLLQIYINKTTF